MKNLRTSLACLALLASAAACSDANPLTAPEAPRFDGGPLIGGNRADSTTVMMTSAGGQYGNGQRADSTADDGGGMGSGHVDSTEDGGGSMGNGNSVSTEDGGGLIGNGTVVPERDGGHIAGSGG
jgi:hypothetical protein